MVHAVDTDKLYREVTAMVADYLRTHEERESKVIEFRSPAQLRELVDLSLPEEAQSEEVVLQACRDALKYCVNTCKCDWEIDLELIMIARCNKKIIKIVSLIEEKDEPD